MTRPLVTLGGWSYGPDWLDPVLAFEDRFTEHPMHRLDIQQFMGRQDPEAALADSLGAIHPSPVLVAWSLGALLALSTVNQHDVPLAGLVLISPCLRFTADDAQPGATPPTSLRVMRRRLAKQPERVLNEFRKLSGLAEAHLPDGQALDAGLAYLAETDLRAEAGRLQNRLPSTMFLAGSDDPIIPPELSQATAAALAPWPLLWFDGGGHAAFREQPNHASALLAAFLENVE